MKVKDEQGEEQEEESLSLAYEKKDLKLHKIFQLKYRNSIQGVASVNNQV